MPLLAAGSNATGQLGLGSTEDAHEWLNTGTDIPIKQIAAGAGHTLVLAEEGHVCVTGDRSKKQLLSSRLSDTTLADMPPLPEQDAEYTCVGVAACWETSFFHLRSSKDSSYSDVILSCGQNGFGELGAIRDRTHDQLQEVDLPRQTNAKPLRVKQMVAGMRHALAVIDGGDHSDQLVGWGAWSKGQTGTPRIGSSRAEQSAPAYISFGDHLDTPSNRITSVAVGKDHSVVLLAAESKQFLYTMGSNKHGQLCTAAPHVKSAGSVTISVAHLLESLNLDTDLRAVSVHCTWNGTYIFLKSQTTSKIISYGANGFGQLGHDSCTAVVDLANVESIVCGSEHVLAVVRNANKECDVWGWGWNEHGNLGHAKRSQFDRPEKAWSGQREEEVQVFAGNGTSWIAVTDKPAG